MPFDLDTAEAEAALLGEFARGDRQAARVLNARFAPVSLAFAMRRVNDQSTAEDIAQEALLRLWKTAPKWESGRARISTWLYRVVSNLATDFHRRRRELPLEPEASYEDPQPGADTRLLQAARTKALYEALETLPERQRLAVEMRHIEGFSNPEIGAVLGVGTGAVENLTARGKRALAGALAGRQNELGFTDD